MISIKLFFSDSKSSTVVAHFSQHIELWNIDLSSHIWYIPASGKVDTSAEESCISFLQKQLGISSSQAQPISQQVTVGETKFSIGPFSIPLGK